MSEEKKILIVDDVARNIQILGNILSDKGYQIAYAQNGVQALKICEIQDFDLILLDIMMPEMDGYEVCQNLKSNPQTEKTPIIFLTAKADMDSIVKGFEIGGQDYITKPFNSAELLARVKTQIKLRDQHFELEGINKKLEQKVEERTKLLQKANAHLEKLDKTKSDFLSIIAHELRTPLNGIIGLTNLLGESLDGNTENREYLKHLQEVSERLVRFSDLALLITSLKIEKYQPDFLPVSINYLVESSVKQFRSENENTNLDIEIITEEEDLLIFADSELIRQSFKLIIENIEKYAPDTQAAKIEIRSTLKTISIEFKDNGPGFTKEALEIIFDLFSAGDVLHAEGTGLSLAAVKLVMDIHNAQLEAMNSDNGGAIVKIVFSKYQS